MTHAEFIAWLAHDHLQVEEQAEYRNRMGRRETPVASRDAAMKFKRKRGL